MVLNQVLKFKNLQEQLLSANLTQEEKNALWDKIHSTHYNNELELVMGVNRPYLENKESFSAEFHFEELKSQIRSRIPKSKNWSKNTHQLVPSNWQNRRMRMAAMLIIPLFLVQSKSIAEWKTNRIWQPQALLIQ